MNDSVILLTLVCITVLTSLALLLGHDGVILTSVVCVLSGLAGYKIKEKKDLKDYGIGI